MSNYILKDGVLYHHGILGQKWGVRKFQNEDGSLTAAWRERYGYGTRKLENRASRAKDEAKTAHNLANRYTNYMDRKAAKKQARADRAKKAAQIARDFSKKYTNVIDKKAAKLQNEAATAKQKEKEKEAYKQVDPSLAKNKQTKRVAYDYHNMNDLAFKAKYQASKKTFAKRYEKTKGDTYTLGLKKAAIASLVTSMAPPTPYYDFKDKKIKYINNGKKAALKNLAYDITYSEAVTRIGYDKAEKTYISNKKSPIPKGAKVDGYIPNKIPKNAKSGPLTKRQEESDNERYKYHIKRGI